MVAAGAEPEFGFDVVQRDGGVAVLDEEVVVVGGEGVKAQGGAVAVELVGGAADEADGAAGGRLGAAQDGDGGLEELPFPVEVGVGAMLVAPGGPAGDVPGGHEDEDAAGPDDAAHLGKGALGVREVFQHPDAPDGVEGVVGEGERVGARGDEGLVVVARGGFGDVEPRVVSHDVLEQTAAGADLEHLGVGRAVALHGAAHALLDPVARRGLPRGRDVVLGLQGRMGAAVGLVVEDGAGGPYRRLPRRVGGAGEEEGDVERHEDEEGHEDLEEGALRFHAVLSFSRRWIAGVEEHDHIPGRARGGVKSGLLFCAPGPAF